MVNEPSVFELSRFYCIGRIYKTIAEALIRFYGFIGWSGSVLLVYALKSPFLMEMLISIQYARHVVFLSF